MPVDVDGIHDNSTLFLVVSKLVMLLGGLDVIGVNVVVVRVGENAPNLKC